MVGQKRARDASGGGGSGANGGAAGAEGGGAGDPLDDGALPKKKVRFAPRTALLGLRALGLLGLCLGAIAVGWVGYRVMCVHTSTLLHSTPHQHNRLTITTTITIIAIMPTITINHHHHHQPSSSPSSSRQVRLGLPATQWITVYNAHRPMKQRYHYNGAARDAAVVVVEKGPGGGGCDLVSQGGGGRGDAAG